MIAYRRCLVCGKRIRIKIGRKGRYDKGYYFGVLNLPVKGTGQWKKIRKTKMGRTTIDVVKWTGKEKKLEYWECNDCHDNAMYDCWLRETIEKLYGKRCKDYESGCACCSAWFVYDTIRQHLRGEL